MIWALRIQVAICVVGMAVCTIGIYRAGGYINSFGRGANAEEPPYSPSIDAQVQRYCHAANNDPGRKFAGITMDAMQIDGRDYYCRPASQRQ